MKNPISIQLKRRMPALFLMAATVLMAAQTLPAQTFTVIYSFTGGADGGSPFGTPLLYNGAIFGTTRGGGANGNGTIYEVNVLTKHEIVLHSFAAGPNDGANPFAGLIQDAAGNLYGTTFNGGTNNLGTLFELSLAPAVKFTLLHSFAGPPLEGSGPAGPLAFDTLGNIFGTTYVGGAAAGYGTAFELASGGAFTTGQSFPPDGALPRGGLFRINGKLYGTTTGGGAHSYGGTIYELANSTALYTFTGGADGAQPQAGVIGDSSGNLYGTCLAGGNAAFGLGNGVIFSFNPTTLQLTVLHTFTGADGSSPAAPLFRDTAGNLYGTTMYGGASGNGTVFKLDTSQNLTTVYSFTGGTDGSRPMAGVVVDAKGNIFGATSAGGSHGQGTLFVITPPPVG